MLDAVERRGCGRGHLLGVTVYCTVSRAGEFLMDRDKVMARSRAQLTLLRVRPGAVVHVRLLPVGPAWFTTHWVGKRQVLCAGDSDVGCPACGLVPPRVVGFVLVLVTVRAEVDRQQLFLLEISPHSWAGFEMGCQFEGIQPGQIVWCELHRRSQRSPLKIEPCKVSDVALGATFEDRTLMNAVAVLYGLPLMGATEELESWKSRVAPVVSSLGSRAVQEVGA